MAAPSPHCSLGGWGQLSGWWKELKPVSEVGATSGKQDGKVETSQTLLFS